eukprot:scaffold2696_cov104-Cylindrotheca_fusiformis.AAC.5
MTAKAPDDGLSVHEERLRDDDSISHYQSSKDADETRQSNTGESGGSSNVRETTKMLQKDWKIRMFRYATIGLLVATGLVVSVAIYAGLRNSEEREFERSFRFQATQIDQAMNAELESKLLALDSLSVSTTSYSRTVGSANETWPYMTVPHFPHLAASALRIGKGLNVALLPIVHRENVVEWQDYSVRSQGWMATSLDFQLTHPNAFFTEGSTVLKEDIDHIKNISEFIFSATNDGIPSIVEDRDIMLPMWQHGPLRVGLPWVNYDLASRKATASAAQEVIDTQSCIFGQVLELSRSLLG